MNVALSSDVEFISRVGCRISISRVGAGNMCEERGIIIKKRRIRGCEDVEFRVGAGNMCQERE